MPHCDREGRVSSGFCGSSVVALCAMLLRVGTAEFARVLKPGTRTYFSLLLQHKYRAHKVVYASLALLVRGT